MDKGINTIEEAKAENIYSAIYSSRQHPGVSLENIAAICAKIFDEAELQAFIRDLSGQHKQKLGEAHPTKDGYCCACEYDLAVFEKKLEVFGQKLLKKMAKDPVQLQPNGECSECGKNLCTCNWRMPDGSLSKEYGQAWAEIKRKIKNLLK